ncbi:SRPBCC domain-containing protein [Paeniglutamicibacter sp. NPDC012692]|uniref:SRPBCC domain-containing protein n=1 Tax=Paeniglutamicibacter sp. NPDC012692 TaxID=3364388 RepID=UPI0036A96C85
MPQPHGGFEPSPTGLRIAIERKVAFDLEKIWDAFTTPKGLEPWVGVLRGSREAGDLQFSMVEGGQEASPANLVIHRCRAPHELSFTTDSEYGAWNLGLELSRQDGVSTIRFIHDLGMTDDPSTIGPGWEYYVQRAIVSLEGGDVESVKWDDYYPALAPAYTRASE